MTTAGPARRTAMYHTHKSSGASIVEKDGWYLPSIYSSLESDLKMLRDFGGICDISSVGKLDIQGAEALEALSKVFSLSEPLEAGKAQSCSNPTSADDQLTVVGLTYDDALVISSPQDVGPVGDFLKENIKGCAHLVDITSTHAGMLVSGPLAYRLLSKLAELDLNPIVFADGSCAQGKAAEVYVIVLRSDIGNTLAYQLYVQRDYGEYLWEALLHAGKDDGIGAFGLEVLGRIRSS